MKHHHLITQAAVLALTMSLTGSVLAQTAPAAPTPGRTAVGKAAGPAQANAARAGNPFTTPAPSPVGVAPAAGKSSPFSAKPAPAQALPPIPESAPPTAAVPPPLPMASHAPQMAQPSPSTARVGELKQAGAKRIGTINGIAIYRNEKNEYAYENELRPNF